MALIRKLLKTPEEKNSVFEQFVQLRLNYMAEYPNLVSPDENLTKEATKRLFDKETTVVTVFDGELLVGGKITCPHDIMFPYNSIYQPFFTKTKEQSSDFAYTVFVLMHKDYHHMGVGPMLMEGAEIVAKDAGCKGILLETMSRPSNDPRAPANYRDSSGFFRKLGYRTIPYLHILTFYTDTGDDKPTEKFYKAWVKYLNQ